MVERLNAPPPGISWALWNANNELHKRRAGLPVASVLAPLASVGAGNSDQLAVTSEPLVDDGWPLADVAASPCPPLAPSVIVFNEVLVAILQAKEVAMGRVWLVARGVDGTGCGRVAFNDLCSALPKLTRRRVRQVLADGEGQYWWLAGDVVYLLSQARVAARLGVNRIRRAAVSVPVAKLAQGVKSAKAVMWSAVHGGRKPGQPISRETLAGMGIKDPRTQRKLEQMAGIRAEQQYAIIGAENEYDHRQAEENGEPVFTLKDYKGVMGVRGRVYLARHLPNVYTGTLEAVRHGKKWFNRQLGKLHEQGPGATARPRIERVFFADGKQAGRAWDKKPLVDTYWPSRKAQTPRAWWTMRGVSSLELESIELRRGK